MQQFAKGQDGIIYYEDASGNIVPASTQTIAAGVTPPPVNPVPVPVQNNMQQFPGLKASKADGLSPNADVQPTPTFVNPSWRQPHILMILVDQLRNPRWLPSGGQAAIDLQTPALAWLRKRSFVFPNYYTAATACTPARSTPLTALYPQQTCMFRTQGSDVTVTPSLNTGFRTYANVLTQSLTGYKAYFVGKWHLSDPIPLSGDGGQAGPSAYGFSTIPGAKPNFPSDQTSSSPNGLGNLGTEGYNVNEPAIGPIPLQDITFPAAPIQLFNDAAIADWFLDNTLPNLPAPPATLAGGRWCATVSFVNPHDITSFPYSYALTPPQCYPRRL